MVGISILSLIYLTMEKSVLKLTFSPRFIFLVLFQNNKTTAIAVVLLLLHHMKGFVRQRGVTRCSWQYEVYYSLIFK